MTPREQAPVPTPVDAIEAVGLHDGRVRVVIESLGPTVDGGRFPIKRVVGDELVVEADAFADGHDVVAAMVLWRHESEADWHRRPMVPLGNDRWRGAFHVDRLGRWAWTVQAWVDPFRSWRHDYARRNELEDLQVAARTGAQLIRASAARADAAGAASDASALRAWSIALETAAAGDDLAGLQRIGADPAGAALAERHPDLQHALTWPQPQGVRVERERARHSSWYEFFPRSTSGDPARHGSLRDAEAWLPYVQRMGFDVVYLPPVHPIGRERRKGPNNTLQAGAEDVGSPWAIGAAEGGHCALHPQLGTLEDFRHFVAAAASRGLEVAMDIAFQCAPDHPWVREHPEWFRQRADGSIQYAENPPKKYQDIYPFDFETPHWRALWDALAGVFEFWVGQGVRIFRVDNPHTKAFPFWEWAIDRVQRLDPGVVFLSEAFTRPRVMHRLAKVGFSQSYTYFTWRNSKQELTEYFTELTQGPGREYFRPNLWPNTPDILPQALQFGGRPAFMARVALAATLGASYGVYGPAYELLEHAPLKPGGEEYLHSEKYECRRWDLGRADSLADYIGVLNRARRENPALQRDEGLKFLDIDNDQLLAYAKATADGTNVVVCVVNLDPWHVQSGWLTLDLADFGLDAAKGAGPAFQMADLLSGSQFLWQGTRHYVQLDPQRSPAHVMQLRAQLRREHDFDYFL